MSLFSLFKPTTTQHLTIRKGKALLRPHKKPIAEIRAIVGLPRNYWNALYLNTLTRLAEYVQELPASEAHHHSTAGGLLSHSIEVALNALRIRRGKLLPPNTDAETVTRLKDVWTYAVFTGAIGHDLGKPITDMQIELLDKKRQPIGGWSPFKGPMTGNERARHYQLRFRRKRIHGAHERASALYIHHILPTVGIEWLASELELFHYWTNLITGHDEDTGILGSIVHEADKRSVAANLAGDQVQLPAAAQSTRKPLHQRILVSLRHQIDEGHLPLNRDGAAGWVCDGKLWMVVKRSLDQIRDHMTQEGQSGVPARNDRIMDELQQYRILIPNGDKAVWKCQVFAQGWPKAHKLTMICLDLDTVWPNAESAPEPFNGQVTPIDANAPAAAPNPVPVNPVQPPAETAPEAAAEAATTPPASQETPTPDDDATPSTPSGLEPPKFDFSALASSLSEGETGTTESSTETATDTKGGDDSNPPSSGTDPSSEPPAANPDPEPSAHAGQDFLNWLRTGLHERRFAVNEVNARIHMTKEGLLLVSPAIFKEYDKKRWSYVQKRFTKLKLHARNANGTNIHEYVASGSKKRSILKGFLIADTDNVFPGIELPNINHALSRLENQ